jgi:hypothetical protein
VISIPIRPFGSPTVVGATTGSVAGVVSDGCDPSSAVDAGGSLIDPNDRTGGAACFFTPAIEMMYDGKS